MSKSRKITIDDAESAFSDELFVVQIVWSSPLLRFAFAFQWNVSFLPGTPYDKGFYGSKASGEPPYFLAMCVNFAIQRALAAAREDGGTGDHKSTQLAPLTYEKAQSECKVSEHVFPNCVALLM